MADAATWLLNALFTVGLSAVIGVGVALLVFGVVERLSDWWDGRSRKRKAAIEAELDRTQAELRSTILQLASAMNGDAHEARKALIRESYLARGEVPRG